MVTLTIDEQDSIIDAFVEGGLLEYKPAASGYGLELHITEKGREALAELPDYEEDNWLLQRIVNL